MHSFVGLCLVCIPSYLLFAFVSIDLQLVLVLHLSRDSTVALLILTLFRTDKNSTFLLATYLLILFWIVWFSLFLFSFVLLSVSEFLLFIIISVIFRVSLLITSVFSFNALVILLLLILTFNIFRCLAHGFLYFGDWKTTRLHRLTTWWTHPLKAGKLGRNSSITWHYRRWKG